MRVRAPGAVEQPPLEDPLPPSAPVDEPVVLLAAAAVVPWVAPVVPLAAPEVVVAVASQTDAEVHAGEHAVPLDGQVCPS